MLSVSFNAGLSTSLLNQRRRNQSLLGQSIERLSTGKRINHAKDDPAGLIAAEQLRGELTEKTAKLKTSRLSELSLRQRDSRLAVVQSGLNDLRGAAVEATGTLASDSQREALQLTVNSTIESFERLAGAEAPTTLDSLALGGEANLINGDTALAQQIIDQANQDALFARAGVAADARYADYEQRLLEDQIVITTETLSLIEDADFAEESSNLIRGQILTRASNIALIYAQQSHADAIGGLLDQVDVSNASKKK